MNKIKAPGMYTLHQITDMCTLPKAQTLLKNGKWYPSRPLVLCSLRQRFERAWMVFTGRADVVVWEEQ